MSEQQSSSRSRPAVGAVPVVSGVEFPQCAALNVSIDTLADVVFAGGHVVSGFYLHKGYNPVQLIKATFSGATIWALYN